MELRQLRHFLVTLQEGSINRAAAALNITQPSLSYSIKALEKSVGAELLIRSGSGVSPTAIGEEFRKYAQNIVREFEKAREQVQTMRGNAEGRLVLGVLSIFATHLLPRALSAFMANRRNPDVDVMVFTGDVDEITRRIRRAEWDVVLTLCPKPNPFPPELAVQYLRPVRSSVYCSASHPLARRSNVSAAEMAGYDWIVTNIALANQIFAEEMPRDQPRPRIHVRTDSMPLVRSMMHDSVFLCIVPDEAMVEDVRNGTLVKIDQTAIATDSHCAVLYSNLAERTQGTRSLIMTLGQSEHFAQR